MKPHFALFLTAIIASPAAGHAESKAASAGLYRLNAKTLDGKDVALSLYKGMVALVVNTASRCGLTPQYQGLQSLHEKYSGRGFTVLGFPSNDFRGQEPGSSEEIKKFCALNYGVTFPLFEKRPVTGEHSQPVFKFLKESPIGAAQGEISWNFAKFLIDRNGRVAARFAPKTPPEDPEITAKIEELLADPGAALKRQDPAP